MSLMMLWLRVNDAGWFLFLLKFFYCRIQNRRRLSHLEESDADRVLIWARSCGFSDHKSAAHQHGPPVHPGRGVNVLQENWIFSTDCEAETCRRAPCSPSIFSCGLYLQEEQWVSCLHAAPTVTSLHVERAAVSWNFSLQLPLSHALSWIGSVMSLSASLRRHPYSKIHLGEERHAHIYPITQWRLKLLCS